MRQMNVLHITHCYFMTGIYAELFSKLRENAIQSQVIIPLESKAVVPSHGHEVEPLYCFRRIDRFLFPLKQRKIWTALRKRIDVNQIDVIHAHFLFSDGYSAYRLHNEIGIPYLVAVRNTDVNTFFRCMPWLRSVGVRILRNASKVVFLSNSYRDKVIKAYVPTALRDQILQKSIVIPNGINDFWHKNQALKLQMPGEQLRILFVGRMDKNKNVVTTLAACNLLRKMGYDVRFTAVGRIVDRRTLRALQQSKFATHIPPQDKEGLLAIYRAHDLFVMASYKESFGLVYAEAMTQGLPVLYTAHQGFDGQFPDGQVGYKIYPKNPKQIAERILATIENYEQISSSCIPASGKFEWESIASAYSKLYREALK